MVGKLCVRIWEEITLFLGILLIYGPYPFAEKDQAGEEHVR